MFTVACVQTNSQQDMDANIHAVGGWVRQAREAGAELITLPENVFAMEAPGASFTHPAFTQENHPGVAASKVWARELGCHILIGSIAVESHIKGKRFNRSLLIDNQGAEVGRYDKIHLFDVDLGGEVYAESNRMAPGGRLVLAPTPWGKLGMTICYDVRFPQLYRALGKAGAEFIAVPAAFTEVTGKAHWHVLLRARAIETGCFIFAPAQCGEHPGKRRTYGHSLIVAPWGEILAEADEVPGIITAQIDPARVGEARKRMPSLTHDREFE